MRDFIAFKKSAIRYWERRRILYNLALVPTSFFGFALADTINHVGDPHSLNYWRVLAMFGLAAFGANICYSIAYALEFVFGNEDAASRWMRLGRSYVFAAGVVCSMLLAFVAAANIAHWEFYFQAQAHHAD